MASARFAEYVKAGVNYDRWTIQTPGGLAMGKVG